MRILLGCVFLMSVGFSVGCGDDESPGPGDAGATGDSGVASGSAGKGGSGARHHAGSGGQGASAASGGAGMSAAMGMIKLVPNIVAGKQTAGAGSGNVGSQQSALRVGTVTGTTLQSLKYYVTSIQLCEDIEFAGSGYSSVAGCIELYRNMTPDSPNYDDYTVPEAKDDTTEGRYIDLMSAEGQATLRRPVMLQVPIATGPVQADIDAADGGTGDDAGVSDSPPRQAGVYRYGLINFYRPIKVKAQFPIIGESEENYFRTKAVTAVHAIPGQNGMLGGERVEIGDTLNGPTEETTYMLNNGGVVFVFQKPFAVTQADIDANKEINIDLVFNPENFGQAYATTCSDDIRVVVCDPANNVAIDMPFVRMSPVPRKTGEKTRKETYLVDYDANSKVRIELYYNDADPEASVQGVDTAIVYNPTTPSGNAPSFSTIANDFVTQSGSVTASDASVSLRDYQRQVSLEGLRRRRAGTVTVHCLFPGSVCSTLNETFTRAYTYVGDTVVSGD